MIPMVSVVIPCYNAEMYIGECIESVVMQDYPNIEIIVVDDASTDNSVREVIGARRNAGIPIYTEHLYPNRGECCASQTGFKRANGEYVCRLSADDTFVERDHISRQVQEMEKTTADWCYNSRYLMGETIERAGVVESAWFIPHGFRGASALDNLFLKFPRLCLRISKYKNPTNSSTFMIRKSTFDEQHLTWKPNKLRTRCDGMILGQMLAKRLKGRALPEIGCFYRVHPKQASHTTEAIDDMKPLVEYLETL